MYIQNLNKPLITKLFNNYHTDSFEYNYVFNDCIPYFDKNYYWSNRVLSPVKGLFDDNNEVCSVCFRIHDSYNSIEFVDIKRIFTVESKRRNGYAEILLKHISTLDMIKDGTNVKYIRMFCSPESVDFYSSMGYKFHGETADGYKLVFQPLIHPNLTDYVQDAQTLVDEKAYIEEQITKFNGIIYN